MNNVLVVDDDLMVAELNRDYVEQIAGFSCCGIAQTLQQAMVQLREAAPPVDLILLDVYLQHESGLDLLPLLRQSKLPVDVIVISSAADAETIQNSLYYGVVDYLIKPFTFSRFEASLTDWKCKKNLMGQQPYYEQSELDRVLHGRFSADDTPRLPKGLTQQTLRTLCLWIDAHPTADFSTEELAADVGISRVSCRKYLIWLSKNKILFTSIHYGTTGRPMYRYRLQSEHRVQLQSYCE
ncbi:MAG: Transcriptional regulatory protein DcuR [Candidatus Erwinia impunctatus]|nr:Transcriptional regulatory protein DcuR [Culicoides impunctatus]